MDHSGAQHRSNPNPNPTSDPDPDPDPDRLPDIGDINVVRKKVSYSGLNENRLHLRVGFFDETFNTGDNPKQIALLHADGDYYASVILTLRRFYDHVEAGGMIIIDDFGSFVGARKASRMPHRSPIIELSI